MGTINSIKSKFNKVPKKFVKLWSSALLATFLAVANPTWAYSQTITNKPKVEVVATPSNIIDRLNQLTWTKLPKQYEEKISRFLEEYLMKSNFSVDFSVKFISKEMKSDWWISKENQLLFMRSSIYEQFTKKELYDWNDWDSFRTAEYEKCLEDLVEFWEDYNVNFSKSAKEFIEESARRTEESARRAEESARRTEESARRTEESKQETIKSINKSLWLLREFYYSYKELPNEEDLRTYRENAKELVPICKEYNVDYKAILSPDVCKFYGIE